MAGRAEAMGLAKPDASRENMVNVDQEKIIMLCRKSQESVRWWRAFQQDNDLHRWSVWDWTLAMGPFVVLAAQQNLWGER